MALPLGGLVAAPCGGDGGDGQEQHLDDLGDLFPAALVPVCLLLLAELVGDLEVYPLRPVVASVSGSPSASGCRAGTLSPATSAGLGPPRGSLSNLSNACSM